MTNLKYTLVFINKYDEKAEFSFFQRFYIYLI